MAQFAFVRYLEDDEKAIVPISYINNFNASDPLKKNKKYSVLWNGDGVEMDASDPNLIRYDAEIIYVAESKEKITQMVEAKRVRYSKKEFIDTDDSQVEDSLRTLTPETEPVRIKNRKKPQAKASDNNHLKEIMLAKLTEIEKLSEKEKSKRGKAEENRKSEAKKSKTVELGNLETRNTGKELDRTAGNEDLERELRKSRKENKKLKPVNEELLKLNKNLQEAVIENVQELLQKLNFDEGPSKNLYPDIGKRTTNKTHLGQGVWLPNGQVDYLLSAYSKRTDASKFVMNLATSVFGTDVLKISSVTGKRCNAIKGSLPKPPLDPIKLMAIRDFYKWWLEVKMKFNTVQVEANLPKMTSYISGKIYELNRLTREPKRSLAVEAAEEGSELEEESEVEERSETEKRSVNGEESSMEEIN